MANRLDILKQDERQRKRIAKFEGKSGNRIAGGQPYNPSLRDINAIRIMAMIGTPKDVMARYLGINETTLRKKFAQELATAKLDMNVQVVNSLFQRAVRGDTTAQIFWCKTQLGWKETQVTEYVLPEINLIAVDGNVVRTSKTGQPVITDANYEQLDNNKDDDIDDVDAADTDEEEDDSTNP